MKMKTGLSFQMKLNLNDYKNCIPALTAICERDKQKPSLEIISDFATTNHFPLVAIGYYLIDIRGEDQDVRSLIERLTEFYKYSTIIELC